MHLKHLFVSAQFGFKFTGFLFVLLLSCSIASAQSGSSQVTRQVSNSFDFDGDGRSDYSVFRPSNGFWYIAQSSTGAMQTVALGIGTDDLATADYDGDGRSDISVYRSGQWWRFNSSNNTYNVSSFGLNGDTPMPADFDGDGKADISVYRPSTGTWYVHNSGSQSISIVQFGLGSDIPIAADYDGDGRADITVFRPSNGIWYRVNSSSNSISYDHFGMDGDIPLIGDFDGDSRADISVWRPSTAAWYLKSGSSFSAFIFGVPTDIPVPADYNGDGKTDIAVFRPSDGSWYKLNDARSGYEVVRFGLSTDDPLPRSNRRRGHGGTSPTPTPTPAPTATPTPTPTPASTATPTATPTPTPTPSPSPTPGPGGSFTCDYYASPTGTSSANGSVGNPWDLYSALQKSSLITAGKTLCLRGGSYVGKYQSNLNGGTVRSAPGEWAVIDGNAYSTLVSAIDADDTTLTVQDGRHLYVNFDEITIDSEVMKFGTKVGNTISGFSRATSGTIGSAAPHATGSKVRAIGHQLLVLGSNTTYRDFEITNSSTDRNELTHLEQGRGNGVVITGSGNSVINLYIHNNSQGIFTGATTSNTLIYGNIILHNGVLRNDGRGKGHGLYLQSGGGYSRIHDNFVLNNFNLNMQGYGTTGSYIGGHLRGTVFANAGSPTIERNRNLIYGPENLASPTALVEDSHFYHPPGTGATNVSFGYGAGVDSATVRNNYFSGGATAFDASTDVDLLSFTGNRFDSDGVNDRYVILRNAGYTVNSNTYYNTNSQTRFHPGGTGSYLTFPNWKQASGYDSQSTAIAGRLPDQAIVRPNEHETGRANIIIYVRSGATSINIDLGPAGLSAGQSYSIRNAFDYMGPVVITGTFNPSSPSIVVQLTGTASRVAAPLGVSNTPATTCPRFCNLVVVPN